MRLRPGRAAIIAASLLAAACGETAAPPPPSVAPVPAPGPVAAPALPAPREPEQVVLPPMAYEARQRRDPFAPPPAPVVAEAKGPAAFDAFKLVGVISGPTGLMALVERADGLGFILQPGSVLENGRVTRITRDEVHIAVAARGPGQEPAEVTLRFQKD